MVDIRSPAQLGSAEAAKKAVEAARQADEAEERTGRLDGEEVVVEKDAVALAEELTAEMSEALSEDLERELGKEERRLIQEEQAVEAEIAAGGSEVAAGQLADLQARKVEIESLGAEMGSSRLRDPNDILQFLRDNLGERPGERGGNDDATLQYGALGIIEEMFAARGDNEMVAAVQAAAGQLLAERADEIHKGMIVTEAAALYASDRCGTVSNLRSLYMDQVVAHRGITTSFDAIVERYGEAGFHDAVGFLLRAASDDLATMTVDTDRTRQKEVLDNLYQLEVLNTVRERTTGALEQVGRSYPVAPDATPQRVMRQTFEMIENPIRVTSTTVDGIARNAVPDSIEGRIAFLREYRAIAAMIPLKIFDQAEQGVVATGAVRLRERLVDAIVGAQDVADAEEQEKLASR